MGDDHSQDGRAAATFVTVTHTTLLDGLRDPANRTVWGHFVDRYRPLVVGYGRRLGLDAEDAEDVAQASLVAFCEGYRAEKYRRDRGRLRDWLFGIVHNQARNWQRRKARRGTPVSEARAREVLDDLTSREDLEALWNREWSAAVAAACLEEVRREVQESTYAAFERFVLEDRTAEEVARELGITPNAVYGAKRRVLRRVREIKPLMEDTW